MQDKLYSLIANKLQARASCQASGNTKWFDKHTESIEELVREHMPSGSGIDTGTKFSFEDSKPNRLVFYFSYHHMDENGYYAGWTDHKLIVTPSLISGFDMRITGRDRNDIKEYLYQVYQFALSEIIDA